MIPHVEHMKHAEALIAKAHNTIDTKRCHLAKSYAAMASAHIDIAREMRETARDTPHFVVTGLAPGHDIGDTCMDAIWTIPTPAAELPIWERDYPLNVVKATRVYHHGTQSDISREEPAYFLVSGETGHHYIGEWLEGLGLVNAWAEKIGTRSLTAEEREQLAGSERVIL